MSDQNNRQGFLKDGTSRRAKAGPGRGIPRILWVAGVVCAIGAFLLFRQPGVDVPTGIGERSSVVTVGADSIVTPGTAAPRSGEVDIGDEARELVPESPDEGAVPAAQATTQETVKPQEQAVTTTAPARPKPAPKQSPPAERVAPAATGSWVVQIGSFGSPENADREATRLREAGWDARVKVGNTSGGSMIYRVRIGYFATRDLARTFAKQNQDKIPGAIAAHR